MLAPLTITTTFSPTLSLAFSSNAAMAAVARIRISSSELAVEFSADFRIDAKSFFGLDILSQVMERTPADS